MVMARLPLLLFRSTKETLQGVKIDSPGVGRDYPIK